MCFLKSWFKSSGKEVAAIETAPAVSNVLRLQAEVSGLGLTISELRQALANQQSLLAASEQSKESLLAQSLDARLLQLFGNLGSTLGQLSLLQTLSSEGREIKAEDVLKLSAMLETTLSNAGMVPLHKAGKVYEFDTTKMEAIKPGLVFLPGEKVSVRLQGYYYKEKIISKSKVDKAEKGLGGGI